MKNKIYIALVVWALLEIYAPYRMKHIQDLILINKSKQDAIAKGVSEKDAELISQTVRESLGR